MKVGNLFSYRYHGTDDKEELLQMLSDQNRILNEKGVYFLPVKIRSGIALVYVYRRRRLEALLANGDVQAFLSGYGYEDFVPTSSLVKLQERLLLEDFPHEIGVFLGYPLTDIRAFIENKGANCPCIGCWKAYTNLEAAKEQFRRFNHCTRIYCRQYLRGSDLRRLTVACW